MAFQGKDAILQACIKSIVADFSTHGHLTATLELTRRHAIKSEAVAAVNITTSARCAQHTGDPVKKYPRNKETADHSSYYLTAIAILEGEIGPNQFRPEKYNDPRVRELIDKVSLKGDPSLDKARPAGISEIITQDGQRYRLRVEYPRGHARNPMTDEEVAAKFEKMAAKHMAADDMRRLTEAVFELDTLEDIGKLMTLTRFKR